MKQSKSFSFTVLFRHIWDLKMYNLNNAKSFFKSNKIPMIHINATFFMVKRDGEGGQGRGIHYPF